MKHAQETPRWAQEASEGPSKGHGAKTRAVREQAILALLSERTMELAAAKAVVGVTTLRRWLTEDTAFQAAYQAARHAAFEAGISRVHALTARAVDTLEDLLNATTHPAVRLGAARTVAELALHQHDAETILRKLDQIEAMQRQRSAG